jgi:hypothetical protein
MPGRLGYLAAEQLMVLTGRVKEMRWGIPVTKSLLQSSLDSTIDMKTREL